MRICSTALSRHNDLGLADVLKLGISEWKSEVVTIVLMGAAAGLMGIVTPYATGLIFDRLIPGAERSQLMQMALILLVIAIAGSMFTLTRSFAVLRLQGKIDKGLQAAVWDRLLSLPVPFFRSYTSGDLASRSLAIAEMSRILTGSLLSAILSGIFSVFSWGSALLLQRGTGAVGHRAGFLCLRCFRGLRVPAGSLSEGIFPAERPHFGIAS